MKWENDTPRKHSRLVQGTFSGNVWISNFLVDVVAVGVTTPFEIHLIRVSVDTDACSDGVHKLAVFCLYHSWGVHEPIVVCSI
jgi:hypothetical protein